MMITNNDCAEMKAPVQQTAEGRTDSSLLADKEIEQGLNAPANGRASVEGAAAPMFAIPSWHRPYAEALMEADPEMREALIRKAERAILAHSLEMCALPPAGREYDIVDLGNAVKVLSQLKSPTRAA